MRKKTILFLEFILIGGPPNRLIDIVRHLITSDSNTYTCIVAGPPNSVLEKEMIRMGVTFYPFRITEDRALTYAPIRTLIRFFKSLWGLLRVAYRHRVDIIYANHYSWGDYANIIGLLLHARVIIHLRDIWSPPSKLGRILLKCNPHARYVAISNHVKHTFTSRYHYPKDRIHVIYDAVDSHVFFPKTLTSATNVRRPPKHIVMMSRIEPKRQIELFIDMAAILARTNPNLIFRHYGYAPQSADIAYFKSLQTRITHLDIERQFSFRPYVTDPRAVARVLRSSFLTITPSQEFALPNTVIESMFCGTPAIAYNTGGNSEIIKHNATGLLMTVNSPVAYAYAVNHYLTHHKVYANHARQGIRSVTIKFSEEKMMRAITDLLARDPKVRIL